MTKRKAQAGNSHAGKTGGCELDDAAGHDDVGNGNAINFPPLHLLEKAGHTH